jgi:hypothetical protein
MINPLLEGIDPGRRPLLFCLEVLPVAPPRDGSVQMGLTAGSAIGAHFAKLRRPAPPGVSYYLNGGAFRQGRKLDGANVARRASLKSKVR